MRCFANRVQIKLYLLSTTSFVSLLYVLEGGASAEIDVIGNEGILALPINFGVKSLIAINK